MRAGQFIPQLDKPDYDSRSFHDAFALILSGLFKKLVISSYLSEHIVRDVFQVPAAYSSVTVLLGVYAYSIQIYCDFSGYSDMAIGIAQLLGFRLPKTSACLMGSAMCRSSGTTGISRFPPGCATTFTSPWAAAERDDCASTRT